MKCFLAIATFIASVSITLAQRPLQPMQQMQPMQYVGAPPQYAGYAPPPPPPVYQAKPHYGQVHAGPPTVYTYPSPAPPGKIY